MQYWRSIISTPVACLIIISHLLIFQAPLATQSWRPQSGHSSSRREEVSF